MRCQLAFSAAVLALGAPWASSTAQVTPITSQIAGTVVFASDPTLKIAGARVSIPGTSFRAVTDSTGSFAFQGLPLRSYRVEVSVETFPGVAAVETTPIIDGRTVTIAWAPSGQRDSAAVADAFTRFPPPLPRADRPSEPVVRVPAPLIVVDDVMYNWPLEKPLSSINQDQIVSIQVVKPNSTRTGRSALMRFGPLGSMGAIMITTKGATPR